MSRPRFVIKGHKELLRKLKKLGSESIAKRVLRKVTNAATTPLLRAVRENIPVRTGALKKSIAKKITGRRFRYNGIVGSDLSKKLLDGEPVARQLHLVEEGFEHVGGVVVAGQHPLQRGFDSSHKACESVYAQRLAEEIEKEALKG